MYAAEVAVDTALGLCILAMFASLLEKAITMEVMVHSSMGPHGMFIFLGIITLFGAVFICVFVKETKGLSDLQKKSLYIPEDLLEYKVDEQTEAYYSRKNSRKSSLGQSRKGSSMSQQDVKKHSIVV